MANELKFTLVLDGKQYTGTLAAAEQATKQFTETTAAGSQRASEALRGMGGAADTAAAGGRRAGEALQGMTGQAAAAAAAATKAGDALRRMTQVQKLDAARDILNIRSFHDIQREIDQVSAAYNRLANSGKLSAQELAVANQAHTASVERLKAEMAGISTTMTQAGHAGQVSAGQTAAAWRQLPMQLQDVGVSLAGGMSPLLVLAQQGPQITSAFGGVRETLVAMRGAITPLMIGAAGAAAAIGSLGLAYLQGAAESRAFEQALIMTGGRIGLTSNQLGDMSARLGQMAGITQGQAAQALAMLATQTGITSAGIERIAAAALRMEAVGGPAVSETAKAFSELAKSPLSASIKLNEQTGFLTESVYKQIRALESQGRMTEAAKVAQEAYASALEARIPKLEANLGTLEKAWKGITTFAREAWDAMLNIGREDTLDQKIAAARQKVEDLQRAKDGGGTRGGKRASTFDAEIAAAQAQLDALTEQQRAASQAASAKAAAAAKVDAQITNDGAAGDRIRAAAAAKLAADLAETKAAADAKIRVQQNAADALAGLREAGLIGERDFLVRSAEIDRAQLTQKRLIAEESIKAEQARPLKADDAAGAAQKRAALAALNSDLADINNQINQNPAALKIKLGALDLTDARALAQEWAQSWQQTQAQVQQFADQSARAAAQLITDPMARARAEAEVSATAIERSAQQTGLALDVLISKLRADGQAGMAAVLQAQRDASAAGAADAADAARKAPDMKMVDELLKRDVGAQMANGFNQASQSMSALVNGFRSMLKVQEDYTQALATQGLTEDQVAKLKRGQTAAQLNSYVTLAGAAKGMFAQHTAGYKVLAATENAFRAAEMVGTAQAASSKIALWWASATAKVAAVTTEAAAVVTGQGVETGAVAAGEAARNTIKTPGVFMAFMSALGPFGMAAAGVAIAAVLGSVGGKGGSVPSAADRQAANGTGTVLGDSGAKSESIANSLDALADVDKLTMQYSAQMAASLRSIEASMAGVSTQILRAGGINTGKNLGIKTEASGTGDAIGSLLSKIPLIGGVVGGVVGGIISGIFGKSSTSITDAGLSISGTAAQMRQGQGVNQYADATTTKKSWFSSSTKTSTVLQDAGDDVARQFGLIFGNVSDSLQAAAGAMGQDAGAVGQRLAGYVIDIPRLSLQGLTGEGLQEAISAAVGAKADEMAKLVTPGLAGFQQVGEGYFETTVRVASATETATETLRQMGVRAVDLSYLLNTQGDIAAEIVRKSIVVAETGARASASSIGKLIDAMGGTAQELADTYRTLVDVRSVLASVGISGQAVTADLIRGAGSLSALKDGAAAYEEKFLTAAEQTALKTSRMTAEFARLGVALPATAADFRHLVEGVSTATAAGQAQLGGLLALSSAFSDFIAVADGGTAAAKSAADVASERTALEDRLLAAQGNTAALRARELAKLDASNRALQTRVWALEDEKKAADALAASGKGIAAFLDELRGAAGGDASVSARRATYQTDLASAQAGDTEASGRIVADARALIEAVKATASDPLTLSRETSRIAAQLDALPAAMAYAAQQVAAASAAPAAATTAAAADPQGLPPAAAVAPAVPVVIQQAAAPVPVIVPPAPFQPQEQDDAALLEELRALRAEVAALRQSSEAQGAAIATNTGRTTRVLEAVTQDGDAITTRATR